MAFVPVAWASPFQRRLLASKSPKTSRSQGRFNWRKRWSVFFQFHCLLELCLQSKLIPCFSRTWQKQKVLEVGQRLSKDLPPFPKSPVGFVLGWLHPTHQTAGEGIPSQEEGERQGEAKAPETDTWKKR